jgi:hypothetical protein
MTPILVYMWSAVLGDGKSAIPQYNPATGEERSWQDVANLDISKLMWLRIPPSMSSKIENTATLPVPNVILELRPGDIPVWTRRGYVDRITKYHCEVCGSDFSWKGDCDVECQECGFEFHWDPEQNEDRICPECGEAVQITYRAATCPQCGAKDQWYCDVCQEFKPKQLHFKNNECRCPTCEPIDKHGLIRHKRIQRMSADVLETHYVLGVRGVFEVEMTPFPKSRVDDVCWRLVFINRPALVVDAETDLIIDGVPMTIPAGGGVELGPRIQAPGEFVMWVDDGNIYVRGDD